MSNVQTKNVTNALGILPVAHGGTGQTTANTAFNALSPMTTLGDIVYEDATPKGTRLAGNTTTTNKFLTQTGNGTISAAPVWNTIAGTDLPDPTISSTGGLRITDWTSFSPVYTNVTFTNTEGFYKRVGDTLFVKARGQYSSGGSSSPITITLPLSLAVNTSSILNGGGITGGGAGNSWQYPYDGFGHYYDSTGNLDTALIPAYNSTTTVLFWTGLTDYQRSVGTVFALNGSTFTFHTSDVFVFFFSLPISGWTSTAG